jgi:hypothetical protein
LRRWQMSLDCAARWALIPDHDKRGFAAKKTVVRMATIAMNTIGKAEAGPSERAGDKKSPRPKRPRALRL